MAKKSTKENIDLGTLDMNASFQPSTSIVRTVQVDDGGNILDQSFDSLKEHGLEFWQSRGKEIPFYATDFSAGFDLMADLEVGDEVAFFNGSNIAGKKSVRGNDSSPGRLYLEPGDRALVPTGLFANIPENFYMAIHSRSGTSWKKGLILTNGVGVVDADYVEEIKVSLTNNSGSRVYIEDGERIAQGLLMPSVKTTIRSINKKPTQKTTRKGGFGSTGV